MFTEYEDFYLHVGWPDDTVAFRSMWFNHRAVKPGSPSGRKTRSACQPTSTSSTTWRN